MPSIHLHLGYVQTGQGIPLSWQRARPLAKGAKQIAFDSIKMLNLEDRIIGIGDHRVMCRQLAIQP